MVLFPQVHSHRLAGRGRDHEGLLEPVPSPDRGVCGPVPAEAVGAPVQAPAAGHRLHGHVHPVRSPPGWARRRNTACWHCPVHRLAFQWNKPSAPHLLMTGIFILGGAHAEWSYPLGGGKADPWCVGSRSSQHAASGPRMWPLSGRLRLEPSSPGP